MSTESRVNLAKQQAALLRALMDSQPVPAGFDEERLHAASLSLQNKRERTGACHHSHNQGWRKLAKLVHLLRVVFSVKRTVHL